MNREDRFLLNHFQLELVMFSAPTLDQLLIFFELLLCIVQGLLDLHLQTYGVSKVSTFGVAATNLVLSERFNFLVLGI